jgi:hypothetical protein
MKRSEWSDKQLEELLQSLPKVSDRQSSDELYRKISARVQDEQIKHTRKKTWVLPAVASVAALFLIFLIGSQFFNLPGGMNDSASDNSASEESAESSKEEVGLLQKAEGNDSHDDKGIAFDSTQDNTMMSMDSAMTSEILPEVTDQGTLITIGIPDDQVQNIIPVSMLSTDKSMSRLEALQEAFRNISEDEMGLNQHFFDGVGLHEEGDKVILTVPANFNLNNFTGNSLELAVTETFRWMGYKEAELRTSDRNPVSGGNYDPFPVIQLYEGMKKGYLIHRSPTGHVFLVPSMDSRESFNNALTLMRESYLNLEPSIPPSIEVDVVDVQSDSATISFSPNIEEIEQNGLMIKAILLTAREFGLTEVTFINTPDQLGDIVLKNKGEPIPVKVPEAPNYMAFPTK